MSKGKSIIIIINSTGPKIDPWGTPIIYFQIQIIYCLQSLFVSSLVDKKKTS